MSYFSGYRNYLPAEVEVLLTRTLQRGAIDIASNSTPYQSSTSRLLFDERTASVNPGAGVYIDLVWLRFGLWVFYQALAGRYQIPPDRYSHQCPPKKKKGGTWQLVMLSTGEAEGRRAVHKEHAFSYLRSPLLLIPSPRCLVSPSTSLGA